MGVSEQLQAHLDTGHTTLAHAWKIARKDGAIFGFTDHDVALEFEGITFRPDTGLSALALQRATGLSVDNTEALGALSDASLSETDIEAGRFDDAEVMAWRVNWAKPEQRVLLFRGSIGELRRVDGAFQAEVRGLSAALNRPLGRVFQKPCTAVLGDVSCGFDLSTPGYRAELALQSHEDCRVLHFAKSASFEAEWFLRGRARVSSGAAVGLVGAIKRDEIGKKTRCIELWEPMRAPLAEGDLIELTPGCDKRFETCRLKFNNALNFQGFPDLPSEDWVMLSPGQSGNLSGGSRR